VDTFPTAVGPSNQSCLKSEEDVLQELGVHAVNMKFFILDNSKFLTIIWHPRDQRAPL